MNKITVIGENLTEELETLKWQEENIVIEDDKELFLELDNSKTSFNIILKPNSHLSLSIVSKNCFNNLIFTLEENSILEVNHFGFNEDENLSVFIKEEAEMTYFYRTINSESHIVKQTITHEGKNSKSTMVNRAVNKNRGKLVLEVNGTVPKGIIDCICNQESKIIELEDSNSSILPNLFIDEYQVEANHSAYIGKFREEELFYLKSRGISEKTIYLLLLKGFLMGDIEDLEFIKSYLSYLG